MQRQCHALVVVSADHLEAEFVSSIGTKAKGRARGKKSQPNAPCDDGAAEPSKQSVVDKAFIEELNDESGL